jgi:hypothetical protein
MANTYFGKPRVLILCQCGRGAVRLFYRHGNWACRRCHKALFASQRHNTEGRKRLKAARLRLQLNALPDIYEPMPIKPKWQQRLAYQRIRSRIQALEAQAKVRKFKKELPIGLFAYRIG